MENPYIRYPSGVSEEKLSKALGLHWDNDMQDWDLVIADSNRIDEFIRFYLSKLKDDDDKFTLMGLIIASFDDIAPKFDKANSELWEICKTILEKECYLHYSTITYWCLFENEFDNTFPISSLMREVWEKVKINFV